MEQWLIIFQLKLLKRQILGNLQNIRNNKNLAEFSSLLQSKLWDVGFG